jgi:hypothetical protein
MDIDNFLKRCEAYCRSKPMSRARLSTLLFGSGITLDRLIAGKGITVRVLDRAICRLKLQEGQLQVGGKPEDHAHAR